MATNDGALEIALSNGYVFTNAMSDDFLIRTLNPNQLIHIGTTPNSTASMLCVTSNAALISGRVGIGITAPQYALHVSGAISATTYCNLSTQDYLVAVSNIAQYGSNTANTANTTANTANTTANTALSAGQYGSNTANTANTTANSALSAGQYGSNTANTANTTANSALSAGQYGSNTANTANTTANSALSAGQYGSNTANTANATANTANTTANSALSAGQFGSNTSVTASNIAIAASNRAFLNSSQWTTSGNNVYYTTGNVGVGTTSPSAPFVASGTNNQGVLKVVTNTNGAGDSWWMGYGHANSSTDANDRARIGVNILEGGAGRLWFSTGYAGALSERMRINESGLVGVGTSNPTNILHVQYPITASTSRPGEAVYIYNPNENNVNADAGLFLRCASGGGQPYISFGMINTAGWSMGSERYDGAKFKIKRSPIFSTANDSTFTIDNATGNIGLGTSNPAYPLDVVGTVTSRTGLTVNPTNITTTYNAITANNVYNFLQAPVGSNVFVSGDIFSDTSFLLGLDTNDKDSLSKSKFKLCVGTSTGSSFASNRVRLTIDNNGNMGIGTSNPAHIVHVMSTLPTIALQSTAATGNTQVRFMHNNGTTNFELGTSNTSNVFIANKRDGNIILETNSIERMRIGNAGNVGIGTTTPSTSYVLDVNGNVRIGTGASAAELTFNDIDAAKYRLSTGGNVFKLQRDVVGTPTSFEDVMSVNRTGIMIFNLNSSCIKFPSSDGGRRLVIWESNGGSNYSGIGKTSGAMTYAITTSNATESHRFVSYDNLGVELDLMRINGQGNVGIGTTSPNEKLHVAGNIRLGQQGADVFIKTAGQLQLHANENGNASFNHFVYRVGNTTTSGDHVWYTLSTAEKMRLTSGGNLGIGTSGPNERLHVAGNIRLGQQGADAFIRTAGQLQLHANDNGNGSFIHFAYRCGNTTSSGDHVWYTFSNQEKIRLTSAGNLGIGTASPSVAVHVSGSTVSSTHMYMSATGSGTDGKTWGWGPNGNILSGYTVNDAFSTSSTSNWIQVQRNGLALTNVCFPNGNLGVNNTSPDEKLVVNGNVKINGSGNKLMFNTAGNDSAEIYFDESSTNSGFLVINTKDDGTEPIVFQQTGTERMRINSTGDLVINQRHVYIDGNANADFVARMITTDKHSATNRGYVEFGRLDGSVNPDFAGMKCYVTDSNADNPSGLTAANHAHLQFFTWGNSVGNSTERMRIRSDGNVGIGTSNPSFPLEVRKTGAASIIQLSGDVAQNQGISLGDTQTRWTIYKPASTTDLRFYTGTDAVDRVSLTTGGSIGINKTNPQSLFDIQNTVNTTNTGIIRVSQLAKSDSSTYAGIMFRTDNDLTSYADRFKSGIFGVGYGPFGIHDMFFCLNSNTGVQTAVTSADVKMVITSGGNVAIGRASAPTRFVIQGTSGDYAAGAHIEVYTSADTTRPAFQVLTSTNNNTSINFDAYWDGSWKSANSTTQYNIYKLSGVLQFNYATVATAGSALTWTTGMQMNSSGNVGIGAAPSYRLHVSGDIYATADVIAYSDSNVKTDLLRVDNPLERISKITGYTYRRIDMPNNADTRYAGVLAQEVRKVLPEVVHEDEQGRLSVAYGNMAALFVEAIKELKTEIQDLKQQVAELQRSK